MYFSCPTDLNKIVPISDGIWNKEYLYEYLVWHSNIAFKKYINDFFQNYLDNEALADLLFSFLLDDYYDGSDCQMAAARLLSKMDKKILQSKKELLIKAQENEVYWKRPFPYDEHLEWFEL